MPSVGQGGAAVVNGRPVVVVLPSAELENVGTAKDYGPLYREVLDRFRPPAEYVARVYETKQARHFYSPEELEAFRRHWTRPISVPSG